MCLLFSSSAQPSFNFKLYNKMNWICTQQSYLHILFCLQITVFALGCLTLKNQCGDTDWRSKWCDTNLLPVQSVIRTFLEEKLLRLEQPYLKSYMAKMPTEMQTNRDFLSQSVAITGIAWCEKGDSNPHTLRHKILNLACLPIPPLSQNTFQSISITYKKLLYLHIML